jgi:hypothetical protein
VGGHKTRPYVVETQTNDNYVVAGFIPALGGLVGGHKARPFFVIARSPDSSGRRSNLGGPGWELDCHAPTSQGSQRHWRLLPNVANIS